MKKQTFKIYCNGHYMETAKTFERAQAIVEREQRHDQWDKNDGYTNQLPTYEIKAE